MLKARIERTASAFTARSPLVRKPSAARHSFDRFSIQAPDRIRPHRGRSSVGDRTNDPRRIASDKGIRRNVLSDDRSRGDDRVLAYPYATDDGRPGCDPDISLNRDGPCDYAGAP